MAKQYEHWCDKGRNKESIFETELIAEKLQMELEQYILRDIAPNNEDPVKMRFVYDKMSSILCKAEIITATVKDANSVQAIYAIDYINRRDKWLNAKGLCYQITVLLKNVSLILKEGVNLEKYCRISYAYEKKLAPKIKGVMVSDDKRRKKQCKKYSG